MNQQSGIETEVFMLGKSEGRFGVTYCDSIGVLNNKLSTGWKIERADAMSESVVYILSRVKEQA